MTPLAPRSGGESLHASDFEILDLMHGLLDPDSRARLLTHAKSCPECERRLRTAVGGHERGLARAAEFLQEAGEVGVPERGSTGTQRPELPRSRPRRAIHRRFVPLLAAAGVLIAVGVVWMRKPMSPAVPVSGRAGFVWLPSEIPLASGRRAGATPAESRVLLGVAAYDARRLAAAESLLAIPTEHTRLEVLRRLYLASTRVARGRPAAAADLLEGTEMQSVPEPWAGEMQWTRALVLARIGQAESADSLIRVLASRSDDVGARARALLDADRLPR